MGNEKQIYNLAPEEIDALKGTIKFDFSWEPAQEAEEKDELDRVAKEEELDANQVLEAFHNAKPVWLSDTLWQDLENTSSWETKSMSLAAKYSEEYVRDWRRIVEGLTSGAMIPRSIVLKKPDGTHTLVGGNTRLMVMRALGIRPRVSLADMTMGVDMENKTHEDQLPGGLADNKMPEDFDTDQLAKGIKVELEHTSDSNIAREVAMDHLTEDPEYYSKLEKIESHSMLTRAYRFSHNI